MPPGIAGPLFRKGHIITEADVNALLDIGKEHIYVAGLKNEVHENEAAVRIAKAALGPNIDISTPKEGKVGFSSRTHGLLKINVEGLTILRWPRRHPGRRDCWPGKRLRNRTSS